MLPCRSLCLVTVRWDLFDFFLKIDNSIFRLRRSQSELGQQAARARRQAQGWRHKTDSESKSKLQSSHRVPDGQILVSDLGYMGSNRVSVIPYTTRISDSISYTYLSVYYLTKNTCIRIQNSDIHPVFNLTDADSLILELVLIKRKTNKQNVSIPTIIV